MNESFTFKDYNRYDSISEDQSVFSRRKAASNQYKKIAGLDSIKGSIIGSARGTVLETIGNVVDVPSKKPIYNLSLFGYNSGIYHQGN